MRLLLSGLIVSVAFLFSVGAYPDVPKGPLPRTVIPSLVQLELKIDPREERFTGRTRIEARVLEATDTIWMHGRDLTIEKAEAIVGKKRLPIETESADISGVLKLALSERIPAGKVVIEIAYGARFGELQGAYRVASDGDHYIVTQMEPLGARNTFPGFDEPSFKQPWDITLIVPEADVALANTRERESVKLGDGWKKVSFERTEALPSYLIAFVVGPWDIPRGPDIAPHGSRKAPIELRGVAAKEQGGRMKYALDNTPAIVHALEDYFGSPYPFGKLDNVAAPDFGAGAMENPGLIVYRDILMFPNEQSPARLRQGFWSVSAHELAHQWFGNLVTMKWWDDLWLNEAFASWLGDKITGQLQPQFHTGRSALERALGAMEYDSLVSTRRIREPIENFTQIESAFDVITYRKGGVVLAMFENYLGERQFRDGVRDYLKAHERGNATSGDLISSVAAQSREPARVEAAFKSYIEQPGVPFLKVDVDCTGGKVALELAQERYLPIGSTADANRTWGIPLDVRYAAGGRVYEEKGIVTGARTRFELTKASECPTWVMPNGKGAGYFRFALAPRWQAALSGAFASLDEREQLVYADAITSAFDAGVLTPAQLLAALPQLVGSENRQTVTAGNDKVRWIADHLLDGAKRAEFRRTAADLYRSRLQQLGLAPEPGESDENRLLRSTLITFLADVLEDDLVRTEMAKAGRSVLGLDTGGVLDADAISADLRGIALAMAVEDGGKEAFDLAEKHLRASHDPTLRMELVIALASSNDRALASRARGFVFEPNLLRRNEIFAVMTGQADEAALRDGLREWIDAHFKELDAKITPSTVRAVRAYAEGMCTTAEAAEVGSRFGERMSAIEGGPLQVKQAVEQIRLCAAAKTARAKADFSTFLTTARELRR